MDKFLLMVLLLVMQMRLMALQIDEQRAMQMLFEVKRAVNRAAHAAAQQADAELLARGVRAIDEGRAEALFLAYLQANLRLDGDNRPLAGSPLAEPVEIVVFDVINADASFPYQYRNEDHRLEVTLAGPGVVAVIRAAYPRIYRFIEPVAWTVKGAAELLPDG